jgi:uncharacterized protein YidB (DUF937 family)
MGLLGDALNRVPDSSGVQVVALVTGMLSDQKTGGLNGLMQKFKAAGLGEVFESWMGTGDNVLISADQITSVFGAPQIAEMAAKVGLSPDVLSGKLADALPHVVNEMTPDGMPKGFRD